MFGRWRSGQFRNFHGQRLTRKHLRFFFIFCPNNSGTTVMSQYLAGQLQGYLPPFGNQEGQMAPAVKQMMRNRPWDPEHHFDWSFIRAEWETLAKGTTFIEGSPPNMMRTQSIKATFGTDSTALLSLCNPYQHISSCLRRYKTHANTTQGITNDWLTKARQIANLRESYPHFVHIPYEAFVADPTSLNRAYNLPMRNIDVAGKAGSGLFGIKSGYTRAMGFLRQAEVDQITGRLATQPDLLRALGYALADANTLGDAQSNDPAEFAAGQTARVAWDGGIKSI